jgi:hypothetical protein
MNIQKEDRRRRCKARILSKKDIKFTTHDEDAIYALAEDGSINICLRSDGIWNVLGFVRTGKNESRTFTRKDKPYENLQVNLEKSFSVSESIMSILENEGVTNIKFIYEDNEYLCTLSELKNGKLYKFGNLEKKRYLPISSLKIIQKRENHGI